MKNKETYLLADNQDSIKHYINNEIKEKLLSVNSLMLNWKVAARIITPF